MTAPAAPGHDTSDEVELLRQLGLPPSAAPEDLDNIHAAVSEYLAAAPGQIRGWAHAQAAALDAAYLQLTDPAGLEGSALKSPSRKATVTPGEPATPPARRDPNPASARATAADAAIPSIAAPAAGGGDEPDEDELEALYASVTPSAHRDMLPDAKAVATPAAKAAKGAKAKGHEAAPAPARGAGPWKRIVIGAVGLAAVVGIAFAGYTLGGGGGSQTPANAAAAQPSAPAIDQAKVADLMAKYQANPKDTDTLLALSNEFYAGEQYAAAGEWLDKLLAIEPKDVDALLARGAVSFNLGDMASAEKTWKQVVGIDPNNVEAHYDLGFLYLNQTPPDMTGVQTEWTKVIQLGPGTQLAQTVQSHLDSFAAASLLPASAAPGTSPKASPSGSPAASPAVTPAASPAPSASAGTRP